MSETVLMIGAMACSGLAVVSSAVAMWRIRGVREHNRVVEMRAEAARRRIQYREARQ